MTFTENPPRTIMELFKMLPEGTLAEVIDGSIYKSSSPAPRHQRIVGKLYRVLTDHIDGSNLGEVFISPCDVFLDEAANAVQPDLIFISDSNSSTIGEDAIHGVPDMLLEVLSPGNPDHDLVRKKELYWKFGVKEYWIIDPNTRESTGFVLKGDQYIAAGKSTGRIKRVLLNKEFTF
jgi:Uma2 family endonuclease